MSMADCKAYGKAQKQETVHHALGITSCKDWEIGRVRSSKGWVLICVLHNIKP
jgi:hypothetical protein